jgi:4-alpha-glucanotransferase
MITKENGVLLHVSSLPSPHGIGTLGKSAYDFVDFLRDAGVDYWQLLPVTQTSYGDSPYQSPSAFAGNPYFIDLDVLVADGLLTADELGGTTACDGLIDYGALFSERFVLLRRAYSRFKPNSAYNAFVLENSEWLDDYSLFMALKANFGFRPWYDWEEKYKSRERLTSVHISTFESESNFWKFTQYYFNMQMCALVAYAKKQGVRLIGDMPIYVAMDSADVWGNPKLFQLDKTLTPTYVAGVPPDYFAEKGQLWGNPLYDWKYNEGTGYAWWHARLRHALKYFDKVRIDHFRGFESFYKIPYGAEDATIGEWVKGPRLKLFSGIRADIDGRVIAEDLGIITDSVRAMLKRSGFPGMKVLQFAFDGRAENEYLPKNVRSANTVYYTGTHDNDTFLGWFTSLDVCDKLAVMKVLNVNSKAEVVDAAISAVMKSKASLAIVPLQDYLGLGSSARMNVPSIVDGNWRWRADSDYTRVKDKIRSLVSLRNN